MREKTIAKSITAMLVAIMVTVTMLFASVDANAATKKVRAGDWKKVTAGKLTKKQTAYILVNLTLYLHNKKSTTTKDWKKDNKSLGGYLLLEGFKLKSSSKGPKTSISTANRALAFCDTYRIKKNEKAKWWSSNNKYVFYHSIQNFNLDTPKITSARYDKKRMIIKFNEYGPDGSLYQKHIAYCKKLKSGKYKGKFRVYKIVKNWEKDN